MLANLTAYVITSAARLITGARALSTYSERILNDREIWVAGGRIAAVKEAGSYRGGSATLYDAKGGIIGPGLVDPVGRVARPAPVGRPDLPDRAGPVGRPGAGELGHVEGVARNSRRGVGTLPLWAGLPRARSRSAASRSAAVAARSSSWRPSATG